MTWLSLGATVPQSAPPENCSKETLHVPPAQVPHAQLQVAAAPCGLLPVAIEVGYATGQAAFCPDRSAATGPSQPFGTEFTHCPVLGHAQVVPEQTEPAAQATHTPPQFCWPVGQHRPSLSTGAFAGHVHVSPLQIELLPQLATHELPHSL